MPVSANGYDPAQQPPIAVMAKNSAVGDGTLSMNVLQFYIGFVINRKGVSGVKTICTLRSLISVFRTFNAIVESQSAAGIRVQHVLFLNQKRVPSCTCNLL